MKGTGRKEKAACVFLGFVFAAGALFFILSGWQTRDWINLLFGAVAFVLAITFGWRAAKGLSKAGKDS